MRTGNTIRVLVRRTLDGILLRAFCFDAFLDANR
jgi:hypothetical protein